MMIVCIVYDFNQCLTPRVSARRPGGQIARWLVPEDGDGSVADAEQATAAAAALQAATVAAEAAKAEADAAATRPVNSCSLVRFLPVSQYLLELASGVRVLECGVLTSREA